MPCPPATILNNAGYTLLQDGRIFIIGGTSNNAGLINFAPLNKTLFAIPEGFTSVENAQRSEIPAAYRLSQNHPNPFNPVTVIAYDLPQAGQVPLSLYALTGQEEDSGFWCKANQDGLRSEEAGARHTVPLSLGVHPLSPPNALGKLEDF